MVAEWINMHIVELSCIHAVAKPEYSRCVHDRYNETRCAAELARAFPNWDVYIGAFMHISSCNCMYVWLHLHSILCFRAGSHTLWKPSEALWQLATVQDRQPSKRPEVHPPEGQTVSESAAWRSQPKTQTHSNFAILLSCLCYALLCFVAEFVFKQTKRKRRKDHKKSNNNNKTN